MYNNAKLLGVLLDTKESHEVNGEKFYKASLVCQRTSGVLDIIPVIISEYVMTFSNNYQPKRVEVIGEIRTHNDNHKVSVFLYASSICDPEDDVDANEVDLEGTICKPPIYRTTPLGREITDLCVSVKRNYDKSDFIPCVAWGKSARKVSMCKKGDNIRLTGRIQSREYTKDNGKRIAYEISIINIEEVTDGGAES